MTQPSAECRDDAVAALSAVVEVSGPRALGRWLDRELGLDGAPQRLPVATWSRVLILLAEARRRADADWPELYDARIEGFFRAVLRFARPDGSAAFSVGAEPEPEPETRRTFRAWADWLADPGLETVVDWWFPPRPRRLDHAPPPLPAWSRPDRPLAILRANWSTKGDFVAIDHRLAGSASAVELFGAGRTWIGPSWTAEGPSDAPARPTVWVTNSSADLLEWTFRVGPARVTRIAVLLRGRSLALVADQVDGPGPTARMRLTLPEGIAAEPVAESRALALVPGRGKASARVLPIGLPDGPYPTDRGAFHVEEGSLRLEQSSQGRRRWLPLLVSWDPARNRRPVRWRTLTVSEKSRICPPETAWAARVTWGRDETLVIYRSLARPAQRACLGHQTSARFLIGLFTGEGTVQPIVKLED